MGIDPGLCSRCLGAFKRLDEATDRLIQLDSLHPCCECSDVSVSEFSPGPIGISEVLLRVLVAPQHGKAGKAALGALSDAERRGLSVFRHKTTTDREIRTIAERLVERARSVNGRKAGVFGILEIQAEIVRKFVDELDGGSCYCAFDTAEKERPSHAEIFQRIAGIPNEIKLDRRRRLFQLVRQSFVAVADFRSGLLLDLSPEQ